MEGNTSRVIGTAALISVGVGTLNSFYKTKKPPSLRFFAGSAAAYVILSAIGEAEAEIGKALAVAVAVTMIFGEGNGALGYLNSHGETDTSPKSGAGEVDPSGSPADQYPYEDVIVANAGSREDGPTVSSSVFSTSKVKPFVNDTIGAIPGVTA